MAKDTFYFSHDYEPSGDPKMEAMIADYGGIGYGIFWRIAEMLHSDNSHKLPLKKYVYNAISERMLKAKKVKLEVDNLVEFIEVFIKDCICDYELFASDKEFFWSNRVMRNVEAKRSKNEKKINAGKLGGVSSGKSRRTKQNEAMLQSTKAPPSKKEATEPKESKVNKSKEEKSLKESEPHFVKVKLSGMNEVSIEVLTCESWQLSEIEEMVSQGQREFEAIAMSNPPMKTDVGFKNVLQHFVRMIQEGDEYQTAFELKRYFRNWVYKQNGSLEKIAKGNFSSPTMIW